MKTSGKGDARFPVAPPVFFARLVTALRSFRRSLLGASPFPLSPAHPWRIDDLAQQRLGHQTAPVCPLRGSQLQKSTVVPDQRLFPINGCSRSTVVPDRRLFPIDGCSRSTVVPDRRLGASKVPKRTGFQKVHGERYKPPGREYRRPACNSLRRGIYANRRLKENRRYALTAYEGKRGPQKNGDPAIPQPF